MKEILPHMFDSIRNEMVILAIIFVAAIVIWFVGNQIDIVNGIYEAIQETIRVIFILEEKLGRDIVANTCVDEFMLDCKNGIRPINALEKQLQKQEIN